MNAVLENVNVGLLLREFNRCKHWIQDALDNSAPSHSLNDIKNMLLEGRAQLWPSENGCLVTAFSYFPEMRMLQIWLMGGNFNEIFDEYNDIVEQYAKDNGCSYLVVNGRKGWERRLKSKGYEFASVVLTKRI